MPTAAEIRAQVALEQERRTRLGPPGVAAGILYLLGTIIIAETLNGAPSVGLLQGLEPALSGVANPAVSPRAEEVKYISHHAFGLLAGSVLAGLAIAFLTLVLLLLVDATRFRRPQMWSAARPLVLFGGVAFAVVSVSHQVVAAIETHNFAVGHDFSIHAADQALTKGAANVIIDYVSLLAGLALAVGMIAVMLNAMRVGLLPRWMSFLGMFSAILFFLPIGGAELEIVPAFWMVAMGLLCAGRFPGGDPPAWAAGEARPWPSAAERRGQQAQDRGSRRGRGQQVDKTPALAAGSAGGGPAPDPAPVPSGGTSRKRRRKRGGRR